MQKYNPQKIESKWQKYWQTKKTFQASDSATNFAKAPSVKKAPSDRRKDFAKRPKKYILAEFPYPSGEGLHMGHLRPYVAGDVQSRFSRLKGFNVMYPMGWDAFGLPAENFAIKNGVHPSVSAAKNIKNAKRQIQSWGLSFDWSREINTTDPDYYKWTQWLFLQFYKAGLAYEATGIINWCPKDKTGLANEEVIDGKCERCGTVVEKKELRQWYLKITAYAEKLLEGLKDLPEWPEAVKLQQANWIGKSTGAEIAFPIVIPEATSASESHPESSSGSQISSDSSGMTQQTIKVFTTRPDTIFGATYMVMAPEHPLIKNQESGIKNYGEVKKYIESAKKKPEIDRTAEGKEKTGVELKGIKAINPATKEEIPVWVADYVLGNYGTGAIMAVPAHDERDFAFAKKFNLPIRQVVSKILNQTVDIIDAAEIDYGFVVNSGKFNGLKSEEAIPKMAAAFGKLTVQYKLRDWVFSRQRYWGEPIPLIHCEDCGIVPVPDKDLPVKLPKVKKYEPTGTGESPLADIKSWVKVKCPKCKKLAWRETNTMPQWAGSSWYWLRYADPKDKKEFASIKRQKYWTPVDVYFGGMEHTTLHLLYSRFWNLFLYDQGLVTVKEPFVLRKPHGIILAADGEKMSKSRGNVVNPDEIVKQFGADTLRMYELFLGPHEMTVSWNDQGVLGVRRFLDRVWSWAAEAKKAKNNKQKDSERAERALHRLIKKVTEDIEAFRYNTAVSSFMEFHNEIKQEPVSKESIKKFLVLLYPFAPHICEELNQILGGKRSLQLESWPAFDPEKIQEQKAEIVVQVNGKVRGRITVAFGSKEEQVKAQAVKLEPVQKALAGSSAKRVIFVPNRLINLVI
jgi:leucyl-tRNA synthetase